MRTEAYVSEFGFFFFGLKICSLHKHMHSYSTGHATKPNGGKSRCTETNGKSRYFCVKWFENRMAGMRFVEAI